MNKIPFVLALLIVIVGIGGYFLWSAADPELRPDASGTTAQRTDDAGDAAEVAVAGVVAVTEVASEEGEVPDDLRRALAASDEQSSGRSLVVQVWLGKSGMPAAAAEVFMLEGSDELKAQNDDPFAPHVSTVVEAEGRRFEADEQGRVEMPPVREWAVLTARLPGVFGVHLVGPNHAEVEEFTLRPDEAVTVRVVDGDGNVVPNVPVGIVQHVPIRESRQDLMARLKKIEQSMEKAQQWMAENPGQRAEAEQKIQAMRAEHGQVRRQVGKTDEGAGRGGARRGAAGRGLKFAQGGKDALVAAKAKREPVEYETSPQVRTRRHTDENGIALFRHFQFYRNQGKKWWPPDQADQFEAVLLMPLQQSRSRVFAGRPVPEEIIELQLPETGSIALRTVDRDGRPYTHPVHAELRIAGQDTPPWSRVQVRKEQNEEVIAFPFVGLGLQFEANCRLDDNDFRWQAPQFAGPTRPGERLVVDLVVAPEEGMLFGRLFDAAGRPLGGEEITFLINASAGRLEGEEVLLDDNGRFHLPYQMRPHHRPPFRLQIRRPGVLPVAGLSMPLETLPRAHVTDIGELRLDAFGVVAQGVVTNDVGEPIAGARVQLQRARNVGKEQVEMEFREEAFATAETGEDGRYALFGELENARYRLRIEAKDHFHLETPDLRRDGTTTNVELLRKSRVLGNVLAPDWMQRKRVRVDLTPVHVPSAAVGEIKPRNDQIHDYMGNTYAHFDWVRAGTYDLAFRLLGYPDPFLRIDSVVIAAGQNDIHPRLRDLNLGAYIFRFEIHPVDQNGQPVSLDRPQLTKVMRQDGTQQWVGLAMKGTFGEVFSTTPQLEVFPMCTGYVADRQMIGPGRSEIVYRRIPPVDLVFTGLAGMSLDVPVMVILERLELDDLPQQLDSFDGASKRMSGWYARAKYSVGMLDAQDTARVEVTAGGPHKVVLRVGARRIRPPEVVELDAVQVEIRPGSPPLRINVPYDVPVVQQAIDAAVQRIAEGK